MRKRKICVATTSAQTLFFYKGLCKTLRKNGWSITLLAGEDSNLFPQYYSLCDGIRRQKNLVRKPRLVSDIICFFSLLLFFLRNKFDVVYVASPKAGLLVSVTAFLARRRVLYSIIGRAYENFVGLKRKFYVFLDRVACCCADKVIVISPSLYEAIVSDGCCLRNKIQRINLRLDVDSQSRIFRRDRFSEQDRKRIRQELGISEDATAFIFVGRICKDKGIEELISAFKRIRKEREDVCLVIVGANDDPQQILDKETRNYLDAGIGVVKTGQVPYEDVPKYYYASDVFVCPTYREALSGVGIEASLMELPVVLTDAIGAKDSLLDGETGVMVPIKQVEPLENAMKLLMENPDLRKRMGKQGRRFVLERFKRPTDEEITGFFNEFLEGKRA